MGCVYLLGDRDKEDYYKIGVTRGPIEKRIKKLQTGNSGEIYLVNSYETRNPFLLEKNLHFKFRNKRVINEWFFLTQEDLKNFNRYCLEIEDMLAALKNNPYMKNIK